MMEGLAAINSKLIALANGNLESFSQGVSVATAPTAFLAELLEKLRNLDGQLMGVLLGQLPFASTNLTISPIASFPSLQNFPVSGLSVEGEPHNAPKRIADLQSEDVNAIDSAIVSSASGNLTDGGLDKIAIKQLVIQTAHRYGVEPALALAVAKAESNFEPNALSPKGAMGVMQLMPETAKSLGVSNPFDPVQNIDGGIRYLKHLVEQFGGNITLAVAAYNAGPNAVRRYGGVPPYPETQNFVRRVLAYREAFQKELSIAQTGLETLKEQSRGKQTFNLSDRTYPRLQNLLSEPKSVTATNKATHAAGNTMKGKTPFALTPNHAQTILQQEITQNTQETEPPSTFGRDLPRSEPQREATQSLRVSEFSLKVEQEQIQDEWTRMAGQRANEPESQSLPDLTLEERHSTNSLQPLNGQSLASNPQPTQHSEASAQLNSSSASPTRLPENAQAVVNRLTVEVPVAESGERVKLQVSLPNKVTEVPTVHVSVKVSNEQLATQLAQQFPTLRQHLWEQGIVLAQWTVFSGWWEGGRRDPAEYFGDWRRLPSASHNRLPTNFLPDEGTWA